MAIMTVWSYTANDSQIGCSELHHQGEFLHNYYTFESVHNNNHDSVVRILVDLSCELWYFFKYVTLIMGHNFFITRSVICSAICAKSNCCSNFFIEAIKHACDL